MFKRFMEVNPMWKSLLVVLVVVLLTAEFGIVDITDWGTYLIQGILPGAIIFPILYPLMYNWKMTWIGQALLQKSIGIGILILLSCLSIWFGEYWGREYFLAIGLGFVFVGTYSRIVALFKDQPPEGDDLSTKRSANEDRQQHEGA